MKIPTGAHISIVTAEMPSHQLVGAHSVTAPAMSFAGSAVRSPVEPVEQAGLKAAVDKDQREQKKEPVPAVSSRQLLEIQGNPAATAENAAKVQRELSPPTNPYPSVQELATVRRAQAMERAARAEIHEVKTDTVDRRV